MASQVTMLDHGNRHFKEGDAWRVSSGVVPGLVG
jgi:hypothetical protein